VQPDAEFRVMDWLSPHPSRDLVDPEETGQEDGGANSVEAWRAHFEEKRKEREEKRQYPKAPFWVLEPKTAPKVGNGKTRLEF
jgi:hypothetical protein